MARIVNKTVNVGVASTLMIGPEKTRKVLILSAPAAGRYSVAFDEAAVLDSGITMHANTDPITLTDAMCEGWLKGEINAIHSAGGQVGFAEILNP